MFTTRASGRACLVCGCSVLLSTSYISRNNLSLLISFYIFIDNKKTLQL